MKNKSIKLWLLSTALFSCIAANAYDFIFDGLYYNIQADRTSEANIMSETQILHYNSNNEESIFPESGDSTIPQKLITSTVTAIEKSTFDNCSNLVSVTIPNQVTKIGNFAFRDFSELTSTTIPNSLTIRLVSTLLITVIGWLIFK